MKQRFRRGALAALLVLTTTATALADGGFAMKWRVTGIAGVDLAGIRPELALDGTRVTGFAGCNRLNGQFALDGDKLSFSAIATTRMACKGPAMAVETAFLEALTTKVAGLRLGDGTAEMLDASGATVVELARAD